MRSSATIAADVDRGLDVYLRIQALEAELAALEARLTQDALDRPDRHETLADPKREGRQFLAAGTNATLPIVLTADKLVQSFHANSETARRILRLAGAAFNEFFRSVETWQTRERSGKKFRDLAASLLGPKAPEFLAACRQLDADGHPRSDIKVEWQSAADLLARSGS